MSRKIDRRPGGIIDEDTRRQSLKRRLDGLERDNYQEVPELELLGTVIKPRRTSEVGDRDGTIANKKPRLRSKKEILRQLYIKKSLKTLIDESRIELVSEDVPTYLTAAASPSKFPPKKFCSVCGFLSKYNCKQCGAKYCSLACKATHTDMRCMKYTA